MGFAPIDTIAANPRLAWMSWRWEGVMLMPTGRIIVAALDAFDEKIRLTVFANKVGVIDAEMPVPNHQPGAGHVLWRSAGGGGSATCPVP